jgi:UDP-N-acetylglucosamine 2-epimerase
VCHPRTKKRIEQFNISIPPVFKYQDACGFVDFLTLEKNASLVITDSGGCIEETNFFKVPCLVIRSKIEREEALSENVILVNHKEDIVKKAKELLARDRSKWVGNVFGSGNTAKQICDILYKQRYP